MNAGQKVVSLVESGSSGLVVSIECAFTRSLPGIVIVGYVGKAVDEARERIRSSFAASRIDLPRKRITINLAPADIPKTGTAFDLGLAAAILLSSQNLPARLDRTAFLGELGLDGSTRPIRGIIGKILTGKRNGIDRFVIPAGNLNQAVLVPSIRLVPIQNLRELLDFLSSPDSLQAPSTPQPRQIDTDEQLGMIKPAPPANTPGHDSDSDIDLSDVVGQEIAKRAVEISAAGGHNLLLGGPPGTGKSMLARTLSGLLPALSREEMLEVTHLHSLASNDFNRIVQERPFRSPHHSASNTAIIGGGTPVRPGELSLAHRGVLLFDELPEFGRVAVEALRQPLETRSVTIARAKETLDYPAHFIFVATANPCPCGHYGTTKPCRCLPHQVQQYRRKLSGPILDRIDLYVDVHEIDNSQLLSGSTSGKTSKTVRARVTQAREQQARRFGAPSKLNADMTNRELQTIAQLEPAAKTILDTAANTFGLSARAYMRTVKVARTIADLDGSASISREHIAEALQYRPHSYHQG